MKHFFEKHRPAQPKSNEIMDDDEFCDEAFLELERLRDTREMA